MSLARFFIPWVNVYRLYEGFAQPHHLELSSRARVFSGRGDPHTWEIAAFRSFHSLHSQ